MTSALCVPRFSVAETSGYRSQGGGSGSHVGVTVMVVDRWLNHRVVASYVSEVFGRPKSPTGPAEARRLAGEHVARLNA